MCIYTCMLSRVHLFATPWTVAQRVSLFTEFSRQEYWSKLRFPPPEDLPNPGIIRMSLTSPALAGRLFTTSTTWEAALAAQFIKEKTQKMGRRPKLTFLQRRHTDDQQDMKRCSTSLIIREMQIKTIRGIPHTSHNGHHQKVYKQMLERGMEKRESKLI